jgi:hypothetical protein
MTVMGAVRRLALAPSMAEVTFAHRGFRPARTAMARHLESIPQHVVLGFEFGIEARDCPDAVVRLAMVEQEFRGFAYEGAAMAFTVRDATAPRTGDRTTRFLDGPAAPHIFLAYIGVGFALARLPRPLWKRVMPDTNRGTHDPNVSWLAVDGYGFDRAYFDTRRWVQEQYVPPAYPWLGYPDYFGRAVDQGIGRALWFIHGGDVPAVTAAVYVFAEERQPDLWSGVGLAAAYAGAGDGEVLAALRTHAGEYLPEVAQGAVFAAKARVHGGLTTPYTETASRVLCGMSAAEAAALGDRAMAEPAGDGVPAYEYWRRRAQAHFR